MGKVFYQVKTARGDYMTKKEAKEFRKTLDLLPEAIGKVSKKLGNGSSHTGLNAIASDRVIVNNANTLFSLYLKIYPDQAYIVLQTTPIADTPSVVGIGSHSVTLGSLTPNGFRPIDDIDKFGIIARGLNETPRTLLGKCRAFAAKNAYRVNIDPEFKHEKDYNAHLVKLLKK